MQVTFRAKEYFAQYMRHKYRRNCQPNTLRQAATSLTQFLTFYRDSGNQISEQMRREDIEAFIEYQQDRGLKPASVRTRLCAVYAFIHFLIEYKVLGYELLERRIKLKLPDQLPRAMDASGCKTTAIGDRSCSRPCVDIASFKNRHANRRVVKYQS